MDGSALGAVDSVIGRLTSLLVSEAQLLSGVRGDVEFISDEMGSMNGFILHVSEAKSPDHQVRAWMKQVRDVAYSSEDCVDLYVRHVSDGGPPGSGLWAYLRRLPWMLRTMPARHQLATRIKELKVRAQEVGDRRQRYGVTVPPANENQAGTAAGGRLARRPPGDEEDRLRDLLDAHALAAKYDVEQLTLKAMELVRLRGDLYGPIFQILDACCPHAFTAKIFLGLLYVNPEISGEELGSILEGLRKGCIGKNADTILQFCYNYLPRHYRSALLYLAIFPRERNMRRASLVRRWLSEGLITQADGMGQLDALHEAEICFDELILLGFLSPVDRGVSGRVKSCKLDHFVHEFITGIARNVHFVDTTLPPDLACHFSIRSRIGLDASRPNLSSGPIGNAILALQTSSQWQVLRVLDLEDCEGLNHQHLMKNICNIILLRYLSLRNTDVTDLPKEIQKLQCLETLDIRQTKIRAFATKCVTLPMLRHLLAGRRDSASENSGSSSRESFVTVRLPGGIQRMKNLEELCHVDASDNINDLTDVSQLLQLRKLGVVLQGKRSCLSSLFEQIDKLHACLRSLSIRINQQTGIEEITPSTEAVSGVDSPPKLLESLSITGIMGRLPDWIAGLDKLGKVTLSNTLLGEDDIHNLLGSLTALQCFRLRNGSYNGGHMLTFGEDKFRSLKSLVVEDTTITDISFDNGAAPKLERIVWSFTSMQSLSGIEHLQELKALEFNGEFVPDPVKHAIMVHPKHPVLKHRHNGHEETTRGADAAAP